MSYRLVLTGTGEVSPLMTYGAVELYIPVYVCFGVDLLLGKQLYRITKNMIGLLFVRVLFSWKPEDCHLQGKSKQFSFQIN